MADEPDAPLTASEINGSAQIEAITGAFIFGVNAVHGPLDTYAVLFHVARNVLSMLEGQKPRSAKYMDGAQALFQSLQKSGKDEEASAYFEQLCEPRPSDKTAPPPGEFERPALHGVEQVAAGLLWGGLAGYPAAYHVGVLFNMLMIYSRLMGERAEDARAVRQALVVMLQHHDQGQQRRAKMN